MLGDSSISAVVGVKDLASAKKFYEEVLGLSPDNEQEGIATVYKCGNSYLQVYQSEFGGTNKATSASWNVDDVKAAAAELSEKGVNFEHYENMPGVTLDGDVHSMGEIQAAWFKDPEGNVLCISNHN